MKNFLFLSLLIISVAKVLAQPLDSLQHKRLHDTLHEIVVTSSRIPENILASPVSITQLNFRDARKVGAPTIFDAIENSKGVQIITPGMAFKVINSRGFANTTNVRFSQLVDGIDNQHLISVHLSQMHLVQANWILTKLKLFRVQLRRYME